MKSITTFEEFAGLNDLIETTDKDYRENFSLRNEKMDRNRRIRNKINKLKIDQKSKVIVKCWDEFFEVSIQTIKECRFENVLKDEYLLDKNQREIFLDMNPIFFCVFLEIMRHFKFSEIAEEHYSQDDLKYFCVKGYYKFSLSKNDDEDQLELLKQNTQDFYYQDWAEICKYISLGEKSIKHNLTKKQAKR